jgi:hypothetical protein
MFVLAVVLALGPRGRAEAAGQDAGNAQVLVPPGQPNAGQPLNAGGSATLFALKPPTGAACAGDSASGGYRVQSYIVSASVSPASLTFGASGPLPTGTGANLRQPLFSAGTPFVNRTTAIADQAGGPGLLVNLPAFSFDVFGAGATQIVPPGTYNVGFACTLGAASPTQLDRYWNVQLTFSADPNDQPGGIRWIVVTGTTTTTSTTTTSTTTTTVRTTVTTTPATGGGSATTSPPSAATTGAVAPADPSAATTIDPPGSLVVTGRSPAALLVWGGLFLVFGRMAVLLGRRPKVLPARKA